MMSENAPSSCEKTPENEFLIIVYKFVNQYITSSFWTICTLLKIGGGEVFGSFFSFPSPSEWQLAQRDADVGNYFL